jgi:hypothetical protein
MLDSGRLFMAARCGGKRQRIKESEVEEGENEDGET